MSKKCVCGREMVLKSWKHVWVCTRCGRTKPEEEIPTNADHIRSMSDEELAVHNVQDSLEYTVDYDWDENPIGEYTPCFKTSDGSIFWNYEAAVEYELNWLKQPFGGE